MTPADLHKRNREMTPTIRADGSISYGTTRSEYKISGTSPRMLRSTCNTTRREYDVTHVWHSVDLPAIVDAIINNTTLPSGYHLRTRKDGVPMVGTGDLNIIADGYSF